MLGKVLILGTPLLILIGQASSMLGDWRDLRRAGTQASGRVAAVTLPTILTNGADPSLRGRHNQPMSVTISILVSYLPAVLYLTIMTFAAVRLGKVPFWAHPALIVPGLVVRALTADNWVEVAIAASAGAVLFLGGVFFLARVVSGATLFTVVGAFALAPLSWGYPGIVAGLVVAGLYSAWRTARRLGGHHVHGLALQTLFAFGVSPGGISVPDPEALPGKRPVPDGAAPTGDETGSPPLSIQPFLLAGTLHLVLS